jgi:creatinine amidohydrolase
MTHPSGYRKRYLPALTLEEIYALPDKRRIPVVIGTGAIEQHGRHLPVAVDSLIAETRLERALALLESSNSILVGPPITYGKSNEHTGFPGTVYVSKKTLRRQLLCIATQLHTWGFRVLAVVNTHGGNIAVLNYTLREIGKALNMSVGLLTYEFDMGLSDQEATYGFHAGEAETAWMLDIWPEKVDMTEACCEFPARIEDPGVLRPEGAPAIYSWVSSDLSESGVMGDATAGTAEKGKLWMAGASRALADAMENLDRWTKKHYP